MRKIFLLTLISLLVGGMAFAATGDWVTGVSGISGGPGPSSSPGAGVRLPESGPQDTPSKTFRLVRYVPLSVDSLVESSSVFLSKDGLMIWNTDPTSGDDGITVTTSTVTNDSRVAGVLATNVRTLSPDRITYTGVSRDVGKRNWGWLQTWGIAEVTISGQRAVVAGYALGTGPDDAIGQATYFMPLTGDVGSAQTNDQSSFKPDRQGNAGFFMDDGAADATDIKCFIKCE